jgi:predicted helicase
MLLDLHIGYETVERFPLVRTDALDKRARAAGQMPKVILKADRENGIIVLDAETQLAGVPREAWNYQLGNRSALVWVLDQHKERSPKDPTIRGKFNTYRFTDYKERVINLLMRVTTVSLRTVEIVEAMRTAPH